MGEAKLDVNFSGTWIKDKQASESMAEAMELVGLNALMRQAVKLIRGVQVTQNDTTFTFAVFSVIAWFKVFERYSLDGSSTENNRRDFRAANVGRHHFGPYAVFEESAEVHCSIRKHQGHITIEAPDRLQMHLRWPEPYGGEGIDEFSMPSADTLHIQSSITVNGKTVRYLTVYKKS